MSILMNMRDVGIARTMKQIRGQFKTLSAEMRRSTADFKNSEKSMDVYKKRTKELTKAIEVTESSMKDITSQLKKMSIEEQRTSAHAEKLRQEYSKQHKNLNMYKRQLTSTEKEMKSFDSTTKRTVFSMEKINSILGTMRKQLNIAKMAFENSERSIKGYENYLKQLNIVIAKHESTIRTLEGRYKKVVREQGIMSHEAIDLKQKILQEKQSLQQLNAQYKQTSAEAKRFAFEQKTATASMSQIRAKITQVSQALQISASKFKLSGQTATAYKAHISELNNSMKQQKLIVQNLSRQYDYAKRQYGATSVEAQKLNAKLTEERVKLKELNGQIQQTSLAHKRLVMQQRQGISSMSQIRAKVNSLSDALALSRSNLSVAGNSVKAYGNHLKALNSNMSQQRTVLRELTAHYKFVANAQGKDSHEARELSSAITQQKIRMNELSKEISQTSKQYQHLATEQQHANRIGATAFGRATQSVTKYKDNIKSVGSAMHSVGRSAMVYMTMPAVAAMGTAVKASIDWEQALAGVQKTTNVSNKELKNMGNQITNMSNKMPFAATEIAGVAESAGQLGVKKQDIMKFTKTMLNLGVATNLTADEAATEFARFANAANMPMNKVDRLGSVVTALGNTTATTEKEIVDMAQRLAGAGHQAGFSSDEIMSVSAAMSSVGINAEAGGTAMTQVMNKITKAVADGGDTLDNFAKVAGVSSEEFAKTWEKNPSKALSMFIEGLHNTKGGAKGVIKALDSVGIKGIREADTVRRMANNHKVLDDALKTGHKAWKDNTALTKEAQTRYATMGSKLKVLKNTFINFMRSLGDTFSPVIIKVTEALTGLFKHLQKAGTATKIVVGVFMALAAIIPPLIITAGFFATAIVHISEAYAIMRKSTILTTIATKTWSVVTKAAALATRGLGLAIRFMTGPIGIAITVITALVAGIIYLWKNNKAFRDFVIGAWNSIKQAAISVFGFLKPYIIGIWQVIKVTSIVIWQGLKTAASAIWNSIKVAITHPIQTLKAIVTAVWQGIKIASIAIWNSIRNAIVTIVKGYAAAIRLELAILKAVVTGIWKAIRTATVVVWNSIRNAVLSIVRAMIAGIKKVIGGAKNFVTSAWNVIRNVSIRVWNAIKNGVLSAVRALNAGVRKIISTLRKWLTSVWTFIRNKVIGLAKSLANGVRKAFTGMWNGIKRITANIRKYIINIWRSMKNKVVALAKALWNGVRRVWNALSSGTRRVMSAVVKFMTNKWRALRNSIVKFAKSLWNGVRGAWNALSKGTRRVMNAVAKFITNKWRALRNSVVKHAKSLWNGVKGVWNTLSKGTRRTMNAVGSYMSRKWKNIKTSTVNHSKRLWSGVKSSWGNLSRGTQRSMNAVGGFMKRKWNSIRSLTVNIANSIKSKVISAFTRMRGTLSTVIGKIKGLFSSMVNATRKGLNKLIKGVNWVGSKLGMGKQMIKPLSTGTTQNIHRKVKTTHDGALKEGTMAVVGDKGPGNGPNGFRHETIEAPNGKTFITPNVDTPMYLPKNYKVHNGMETYHRLNNLPHFSLGSLGSKALKAVTNTLGGGKQPGRKNPKKHNDVATTAKNTLSSAWGHAKNIGGQVADTTKGWAKAAGKQVSHIMGEVEDWIEHPKKLLNTVIDKFGFNFNFLKGAEMPYKIMKGAGKQLKEAAYKKIKDWLDEYGGDGDGTYIKYLDNITTPYSPNGPPKGYPFGWAHPGIDLPYNHEPVYSTLNGTAYKKYMPGGFGNYVLVKSGALEAFYGHLKKILIHSGQHVHPGSKLAISGGDLSDPGHGASTGHHLHYEMHKNGKPIDPVKWLKTHNGKGGKSGGSRAARAWRPEVIRALKANHLPTSSAYVNAWIRQIQSESGGNAGARQQVIDVNTGPNAARGLVQVTPSTFAASKLPGHGNIMNGLDNLMAGIHYAKTRYGSRGMLGVIGHGHGYKTGGLISTPGWYNIAENGHPEWIIPTDPSRHNDAMKLLALAANDIDRKQSGGNKRPNNFSNVSLGGNDDRTEMLLQIVEQQQKQIDLMMEIAKSNQAIADKDFEPVIDKYQHKAEVHSAIDDYNRQKNRRSRFNPSLT